MSPSQSLQTSMMQLIWLVSWSRKRFRPSLQELQKVTREGGRNIKGLTATATTISIINNKRGDKKVPKPILPPQLSKRAILEPDHYAISVICIMTVNALPSARIAKG
ncbi:hypothetical protein Tco_0908044 [Tanacetum coccineum]|uniref:Uncharacterized protein n=1 Tax=Tanacetum coccineum TaxID=301880 RepID=A0ABQ5CM53_9ASTR